MYEKDTLYDLPFVDLEETTEDNTETTETSTQDLSIEYVTTEDQFVDTRLYLSAPVSGADLNDVYSLMLSTRNIVLLFFMIWLIFKVKTSIHSVLSKIFETNKK